MTAQKRIVMHTMGNQTVELIKYFLDGGECLHPLTDKIMATYHTHGPISYKEHYKEAKAILARSDKTILDNIFSVKVTAPLTDWMLAVLIRCVNIHHHANKLIVVNDQIVYVPAKFEQVEIEQLRIYVHKTMDSHQRMVAKASKKTWMDRLVHWFFKPKVIAVDRSKTYVSEPQFFRVSVKKPDLDVTPVPLKPAHVPAKNHAYVMDFVKPNKYFKEQETAAA